MNKQTEALKMAISAMQVAASQTKLNFGQTIQACKEALAQPAQEVQQEPLGWVYEDELSASYPYDAMFKYSAVIDGVRMFPVFSPSPAIVQEPIILDEYDAGLLNDYGAGNVDWWQDYIRAELGRAYEHYQSQIESLYTSPPAREPLSEDEIAVIGMTHQSLHQIARAIEKAHGIGA